MAFLTFLDILAEIIQLVFEIGVYTRKYIVPAIVYSYVVADYYLKPALNIPYYYGKVKELRLAHQT